MGKSKTKTVTQSNQQRQLSPEQQDLVNLQLQQARALNPSLIRAQQGGLETLNQIFTGLNTGQISETLAPLLQGVTPDVARGLATQSVEQVLPQFQALGVLGSGTSQALSAKIANRTLLNTAQFNIANLQNTLSQALGGQAQVTQPILGAQAALGSSLSNFGTTRGSTTTRGFAPNPFLQSFQTSLGQSLGSFQLTQNPFFKGGTF